MVLYTENALFKKQQAAKGLMSVSYYQGV